MQKTLAGLIVAAILSCNVGAHTLWLVPSHYVLSKQDSWIAVDVSAGNMTFVPDKGVSLQALSLISPEGNIKPVTDVYQGKRKSMADVKLSGDGTYRLELSNPMRFMTTYQLNGERKRLMADKQQRAAQLPPGATDVATVQIRSKSFAYITVNAPSNSVLRQQGEGLELSSTTHPADVVAHEPVSFTFTVNGRAQTGVKGILSFAGELYRNEAERIEFETDAKGQFNLTPQHAGRYLIEASYAADTPSAQADSVRESLTYSFEVALP